MTLQGQVQAVLAAKAVTSKGSTLGQSLDTAVTLQGQVQAAPAKAVATLGQSLETAVTLQGQVQAVLTGIQDCSQPFKRPRTAFLGSLRL